jgi:hypothetical protein
VGGELRKVGGEVALERDRVQRYESFFLDARKDSSLVGRGDKGVEGGEELLGSWVGLSGIVECGRGCRSIPEIPDCIFGDIAMDNDTCTSVVNTTARVVRVGAACTFRSRRRGGGCVLGRTKVRHCEDRLKRRRSSVIEVPMNITHMIMVSPKPFMYQARFKATG